MDDGLFMEYHLTIKKILLLRRAGKPTSRGARHHSDGGLGGVLHNIEKNLVPRFVARGS